MRITHSAVAMQGEHFQMEKSEKRESLRVWQDKPQAEQPPAASPAKVVTERTKPEDVSFEPSIQDKLKLSMLKKLLGLLTDQEMRFYSLEPELVADDAGDSSEQGTNDAGDRSEPVTRTNQIAQQGPSRGSERVGWGIAYDYHESYTEVETTRFSAAGKIQTADGKSIDFSVQLQMSRFYMESTNVRFRAGDAKLMDPLVINFDAPAAELTQTKYRFDLDADGEPDQVSFVSAGSGFLALDLDGDGQINDGRELFGPKSGDGFAELAAYDEDGNGWIDEADSVYDRLRIWTKDEEGRDQLFALGQKGIGAIFVGSIATPYHYKTSPTDLLGQVRSTGIFLRENGTAGTVQQIDLAL
ncbi:hypothetical protein J7643_00590 [bacterium]|nr:hypothetical protein [bacterium]